MQWTLDVAIQRMARTLAEEWWNGKPWNELTDQEKRDALIEAEAIETARAEREYDRQIERTQ